MSEQAKHTPSAGAMRAANAIGVLTGIRQKYYRREMAEIIDRETAAPYLLEVLQSVLARLDIEAEEFPGKMFPCAAMRSYIREAITRATEGA